MPLINGIGDEVVHFAAVIVVMAVAALAWWSTNARPDRYRTALQMRSHAQHPVLLMRSHAHHPVTVSIRAPPPMLYTNRQSIASGESTTETAMTVTNAIVSSTAPNGSDDVVPLQEMDSIVDADMALLDNNRLHFYRRVHCKKRYSELFMSNGNRNCANICPYNSLDRDAPRVASIAAETAVEETEMQEDSEPASNAQIREMDSIVSAMEADVATDCDVFSRPRGNESNPTALVKRNKEKKDGQTTPDEENAELNSEGDQTSDNTDVQANDRKILIRLKYLNDTLKEVEGSLDELLKDFKWRHFSNELMSDFRVRLIFNGRVLGDEATLRALGLHHRAVVHCLVHPRRPTHQRGGTEAPAAALETGGQRAPPERAWDLENILMTLVSVALTVVWFFRCEYSNMFTASASVALFGLTVFYSVAIFGLYLSDTFHFDRRQPQAVPNN